MKIFVLLGAWFAIGLVALAVSTRMIMLKTRKLSSNGIIAFFEALDKMNAEIYGDYSPIRVGVIALSYMLMWPCSIAIATKEFDALYEECKDL